MQHTRQFQSNAIHSFSKEKSKKNSIEFTCKDIFSCWKNRKFTIQRQTNRSNKHCKRGPSTASNQKPTMEQIISATQNRIFIISSSRYPSPHNAKIAKFRYNDKQLDQKQAPQQRFIDRLKSKANDGTNNADNSKKSIFISSSRYPSPQRKNRKRRIFCSNNVQRTYFPEMTIVRRSICEHFFP